MVDVEDDHLGGAAGLAAALDDAGKGIEAAHEAQRAAGRAAAGEHLHASRGSSERLVPVPEPHLKSMPSVLARVRMESSESFTRVDEAGRALRIAVAGDARTQRRRCAGPSASSALRSRLQAVAAHVEPYRRVERHLLVQQQVRQFVVEDVGVFGGGEVAARNTPVANGLGHAA